VIPRYLFFFVCHRAEEQRKIAENREIEKPRYIER
jgi:hypothetical protein